MNCIIFILLTFASYGQSASILLPSIGEDGSLVWLNFSTVDLKPVDVKSDEVTYYLYTATNQDEPAVIADGNVDALDATPFNPEDDILVAVHGWTGTFNTSLGQAIVPTVFGNGRTINVIVVDWHLLSQRDYLAARNSVAGVGARVGTFISDIQAKYGVPDDRILLVGHSLGAHIVGGAGRRLGGRMRSIVGLDPAGPLFAQSGNDTLSANDAQYVEVIHTNGGLLGLVDALGDSDFYPNGGRFQAGCLIHPVFACDHMRSIIYYGESLRDDEVFLGKKCSDYMMYLVNLCGNGNTAKMGQLYPDTSASGNYYLKTRTTSPYAEN